jgi:hypothetical protein
MPTAMGQSFIMTLCMQLVAKKKGNENFPDVNLVLSNCQLIVYLTVPKVHSKIKKPPPVGLGW